MEIEEERRLFYVALTRARDLLTISWAAARTPGARGSRKPSRFLDGIIAAPAESASAGGGGATARRTGRRGATVYSECTVCGEALVSAREQRVGRHGDCPAGAGEKVRDALRTWRAQRAREQGSPPFAVLTDAALEAIAERNPRTPRELLAVPGLGATAIQRHGEAILAVLDDLR